MKGLRHWAWVRYYRDDAPHPMYLDCNNCKATRSVNTRRGMGCGFLPLNPRRNVPVAHEVDGIMSEPDDVCAGWYVNLPAVNEAMIAHAWWTKGQLENWCGEEPSGALMEAVTLFQSGCGEVEGYINRKAKESVPNGPR